MEFLDTLLNKLRSIEQDIIKLASPDETNPSRAVRDTAAKEKAHQALNKVRQAILAIEEQQGAVPVDRQEHTITEDPYHHRPEGRRESHESFGILEFTRPTGRIRLVGSTMDALPSWIQIRVYRADRIIDPHLHTEHYFHTPNKPPLLELRMSTFQWAEAICNMNGVMNPCTLNSVMGVRMDEVPPHVTTPLEQILNDTKEAFKKGTDNGQEAFKADVDAVLAKIPALKLSGTKAADLEKSIRDLYERHMVAPVRQAKWATQRFTEDTEQAVAHARTEIEAAMGSLIQRTGLAALRGELKGLEGASLVPNLEAPKKDE